jgi:tRNA pseudouridine synthase 10
LVAAALAADAKSILQLKQYKLCRCCLERHTDASRIKPDSPCYICRGLMDDLDSIVDRIMAAVQDYEFGTFVVGATLPTQIYEREDAMRARLKIRGKESIKNHLTRELGIRLVRLTKRKADYLKPDITIRLAVDKENNLEVAVKSRPVALAGRYFKKSRGMPQKQDKCPHCEGKGCNMCNNSGLSGYASVEGIIAKELLTITKGQAPKFSWIGSEDQSSLVLGTGRPFSVRVFNPKKRELGNVKIKSSGVSATMSVQEDILEPQARFTVKTKIHAKCASAITKQNMKKLNSLAGSEVSFENRFKTATKKIYSARARQLVSNQFTLTITADGGLMIKQFVGGEEYMKPNISEILGSKCECVTFDILDVALQQ